MSAAAQSADAAGVVNEAGQDRNCTDVEGSRICGEVNADGVLVVRVYPVQGLPVAVYLGEIAVWDGRLQPAGRHCKREDASPQSQGPAALPM
jgi:hypothetical protein